jgi:hypothetical protein
MFLNRFVLKVCLCLCLFSLIACQSSTAGNLPEVDVWDLMIPESEIPFGWQLLERSDRPIVSFGEEKAAMLNFYYQNDPQQLTRGGITVSRHRAIRGATQHYETLHGAHFNADSASYYTPLFIPEDFDFVSNAADEWQFRCAGHQMEGLLDDTIRCIYLARYGQYVVFFPIATEYQGEEIIDIAAIQDLIEVIDNNMKAHLQP